MIARKPMRENTKCQKLVARKKEAASPTRLEKSSLPSRYVPQTVSIPMSALGKRRTQGSVTPPRDLRTNAWMLMNRPSRPLLSG